MPTQQEYNVVKQPSRDIRAMFYIYDVRFNNIGNIEGVVIGSPSFTNNSTSNIRRTCNVQLHPIDSSFDLVEGSKLWLDKYIKVELGIYDIQMQEYVYTNMGYYITDNPSQNYSATDNTLSFSGSDLMAKLTGLRGGNLEGLAHNIPQGTNIRNLLIDTIALAGFTRYEIEEFTTTVPNDIKIDAGSSAYTIIQNVLDLLPNWQAYFDVDAVFHFNQIPNGSNETVLVDDDIWQSVLISYTRAYDEDNIKNYIEVLGKEHESTMPCGEVTNDGSSYVCDCADAESLANMLQFSFTTPATVLAVPKININSWGVKDIKNEDGTIPTLSANTYYVIEYSSNGDYFKFLSSVQPRGIAYENNPQSPFYINKDIGILRIVLSGGEYDNISSDILAQQRAKFELYQRCRLLDSVNITCVPIYWLDTNWLIEITLPNKNSQEETNQYLIKSINTTFGVTGTQTIQLMRYYPYFPST